MRFYSASAILELQIYVSVEQFGAEIISLLSGHLVSNFDQQVNHESIFVKSPSFCKKSELKLARKTEHGGLQASMVVGVFRMDIVQAMMKL